MNLRVAISLVLLSFFPSVSLANEPKISFQPWGSPVRYSSQCSSKSTGQFINRFSQELVQATPWLELCSSDITTASRSKLDKLGSSKEMACSIKITPQGKIQPGIISKSSENQIEDQKFLAILKDSPSLKYAPPNMLPFHSLLEARCKNGKISIVIVPH
jgi:hypothetical protein